MDSSHKGTDSKIYTLADFVHAAEIDNYNLFKLLNFCKRSKLTHKVRFSTYTLNENGSLCTYLCIF